MENPTASTGVRALSTVLHTLDLLRIVADSDRPLRLAEVVQRSGLGRATAYQRLLTLVEAGFLDLDGDQRYRISLYPARLAHAAMRQAGIGPRAEGVMADLMQTTGETVSLAVLDQGRPCIVARVETNLLLRAEQKIGSYMSLAGSASGRVLVAFASAPELAQLAASGETMPDPAIVAAAKSDGYALSSGYSNSGVTGIAAPVFGAGGRCMGALSLVIPEQRYQLDQSLGPLKQAAARLSSVFMGGTA
ncbi:IclR family transcriptional regulator [Gemmobacter sp.]|uniref:IclR family transcriptional regulator n=1 Tax=Gemmobacter sp. TaxID=1898957 RepID=UPI002AFE74D6|nr:IclR family transcriptional regulator [Gemmobacter sp.]